MIDNNRNRAWAESEEVLKTPHTLRSGLNPFDSTTESTLDDISIELINDISFFRDIKNDFYENEDQVLCAYLDNLEKEAFRLLIQHIGILQSSTRLDIAVIGNFSSGKSSVINSFLGREICPVKVNPTTSSVTKFIYSEREKIFLVPESGMGEKTEISHHKYVEIAQHKTGATDKWE